VWGYTITSAATDLLMVGEWPGNVRQLCNEINGLSRAEDGAIITPDHLSPWS
jgi:transcriptional regulator with PAS, ATPase and Fis domain